MVSWNEFANLAMWRAHAYSGDVAPVEGNEEIVEMQSVGSLERRFGDWEVRVFFSGNDGCWKWSAEKVENVGRNEYPSRGYDEIGMSFPQAMEECYEEMAELL